MRFSAFTLPALMGAAFAAPIVEVAEKRDSLIGVDADVQLCVGLYAHVQTYTGKINSTVDQITSGSLTADIGVQTDIANLFIDIALDIQAVLNVTVDLSVVTDDSVNSLSDSDLIDLDVDLDVDVVAAISLLLVEINATILKVQAAIPDATSDPINGAVLSVKAHLSLFLSLAVKIKADILGLIKVQLQAYALVDVLLNVILSLFVNINVLGIEI